MIRHVNRWIIVQATVAAVVIVFCVAGLLRDVRLPSDDIVSRRHNWRRTYVERWQEELLYALVIIAGGIMLTQSISKLRKP